MASILNTKINSYAIEKGFELDTTYALPIVETGTASNSTAAQWSTSAGLVTYQQGVGPIGGSGSYNFNGTVANGMARIRNTNTTMLSIINDRNYSSGVWVKFNSLPQLGVDTVFLPFYVIGSVVSAGFGFYLSGTDHTTNPNQIYVTTDSGTNSFITTGITVTTGVWYFVSIIQNGTSTKYYVNGTETNSITRNLTTNATALAIGSAYVPNDPTSQYNFNVSNVFIAPTSVIGATEIAEIYNTGITNASLEILNPTITTQFSTNILTTPATITALFVEPTIIIITPDTTQITTSFVASIELLLGINISIAKNINYIVTENLIASATFANAVDISTGSNISHAADLMIADAIMRNPFLPEQPFLASATMPDATIFVTPNYFNLIKPLNPYLYINSGATNPINYGYQTGTFTKDTNLQTLQNPGIPLSLVAEGKCWKGPSGSSNGRFIFTTSSAAVGVEELISSGTFAYEFWVNIPFMPTFVSDPIMFFVDGAITVSVSPKTLSNLNDGKVKFQIKTSSTTYANFEILVQNTSLSANNWNHFVIQSYNDGTANKRRAELWINGTRYISEQYNYSDWTSTNTASTIFGSSYVTNFGKTIKSFSNILLDELAIYSNALTNSQIINHNNFILGLGPNFTYNVEPINVDATSGNHAVFAVDNVTIPETPAIANILIQDPIILTTKNILITSTTLNASIINTDAIVYYGKTMYADPLIVYAESKEGFVLNSIYYDYVQTNITPYRYVTFDDTIEYTDFGIDNDYFVIPTLIGGSIVNPQFGINGKSVKTYGNNYITDGVILNESEYNDNWGTGNNSWHSSFWMQRDINDNSTGLRVLWNLNGAYDNQHIVLYHYQNKLHLQINDQSGTHITITSANNIDVFDFNSHHFVINNHHNNNKNHLYVYIDGILVLDQDINTYKVTTINGTTNVGPNDEENNLSRLAVGCLITPFASTALPVLPTNTKLIIDEIFWDKNGITQNQVINLYTAMPGKSNKIIYAELFIASGQLVMPAISTQVNFIANTLTASAELIEPLIYIVRIININANIMNSSAIMNNAIGFVQINITADIFVVTAIFNDPGIIVAIPGGPMIASIELANRPNPFILPTGDYGISVSTNGIVYELREFSPYIKYLRIAARNQKIYKDMEIL